MKFTRDAAIWWVVAIGGLATFLTGHYDLLTKAFPGLSAAWQARIELIGGLAAFVAGYLRMSPLALSPSNALATRDFDQTLTPTGKVPTVLLACALAGALALSACGSARHVATVADASIAQAIFAVDDAEYLACQQHVLSQAQCDALNEPIKTALRDVKALTAAIQTMPANGTIPKSLPAVLADLNMVQGIINQLGAGPTFAPITEKLSAAQAQLVALLNQIAGGQ